VCVHVDEEEDTCMGTPEKTVCVYM
jgi:hypothetical protein